MPYLARLGISHVYASPILKARPGSMHGYDVTDHTRLNPELGTPEDFEKLVATLHEHGMGLIVDIVPNHLGIMGDDNVWWLDVLENGPAARARASLRHRLASATAASMRDRVLVPMLGDVYGAVLESGELRLQFDATAGSFCDPLSRAPACRSIRASIRASSRRRRSRRRCWRQTMRIAPTSKVC